MAPCSAKGAPPSKALVQLGSDEVHEFLTGVFVFEESPGKLGGGGDRVLFLDAAH